MLRVKNKNAIAYIKNESFMVFIPLLKAGKWYRVDKNKDVSRTVSIFWHNKSWESVNNNENTIENIPQHRVQHKQVQGLYIYYNYSMFIVL